MTFIFWQKMPYSILLKVTKIEQVMLITFWVIQKNEEGGGAESATPPVPEGLIIENGQRLVDSNPHFPKY